MIRPINDNEKTTADIIESRFFTTSVRRHKKRSISRSRYADDNPLLTAGVILFTIIAMMFLMVQNIASAKTQKFDDSNEYNTSEPEIIKTKDIEKRNSTNPEEKVASNSGATSNLDNSFDLYDINLSSTKFADVDTKRFYQPHRSPETSKPISNQLENRLTTNSPTAKD